MRENIERHIAEHEHGQVPPPEASEPTGREMEREVDEGVFGPGAMATKSQIIGSSLGIVLGGVVGLILGLIAGLLFFGGDLMGVIITAVVGIVAGSTALGMAGGFVWNRGAQERGEPDI